MWSVLTTYNSPFDEASALISKNLSGPKVKMVAKTDLIQIKTNTKGVSRTLETVDFFSLKPNNTLSTVNL